MRRTPRDLVKATVHLEAELVEDATQHVAVGEGVGQRRIGRALGGQGTNPHHHPRCRIRHLYIYINNPCNLQTSSSKPFSQRGHCAAGTSRRGWRALSTSHSSSGSATAAKATSVPSVLAAPSCVKHQPKHSVPAISDSMSILLTPIHAHTHCCHQLSTCASQAWLESYSSWQAGAAQNSICLPCLANSPRQAQ